MTMTTENELEFARRLAAEGQTPAEIARELYAQAGIGVWAEEVAEALRDGLNLSTAEITEVMGASHE